MKKATLTLLLVLTSISLFSQTDNHLKLYAIIGTQINNQYPDFNTSINSDIASFSMGAGSSYYFGNLFVGTEFYYSNGKKSNQDYKLDFSGINTVFSVGYNVLKSSKFQLEPQVGFLMANNKMLKGDIQANETTNFTHNNIGITPAVSFNYKAPAGLVYGLKVAYNFALNKDENWKNSLNETSTNFSTNNNSIVLQLNIGGILDFKKKVN